MMEFPHPSREDAVRIMIRSLVCLAAFVCAFPASAQTYPTKPIRMIVTFAAGGPTDVIARIVAQKASETFGHQVVVENIPGAGGNIGLANALRAPADGYTLVAVSTGFIVNPSLYSKVPYAIKDFAPISLVAASPNVITVHPSVPAKSVQELIALTKANPGKYSYGQPGAGSTPHLAGELFKLKFGLDITMVPFGSAAPAITSTIGGHTPIAFTALPPAISNIQDGKLRGLAVLAIKRNGFRAGCPHHGRGQRAGPGVRYGDRHRDAGRDAARDCRALAPRDRAHRGAARRQSAPAHAWLRSGRQFADAVRRADQN
jgi:tripartite-type tricarboxylate transporter receptor subunit TctC